MEETSEELLNFSVGIDLLGPDPTSNKNKAEKTRKLHVSQICRKTSCSKILLLRGDPCCRSIIKEFANAFSCTYIEFWMQLGSLESTRATLTHFSCSPNFPRASITRYTHAKHEQILNYPLRVSELYRN